MAFKGRPAPAPQPPSAASRVATGLGWFSLALGVGELLSGRKLSGAVGIGDKDKLTRSYGARELATGAAILKSHDPGPWIWGRVAGDLLDIATLILGSNNPRRPRTTGALLTVGAVTVLDLVCALSLSAEKRRRYGGAFDYSDRSGFSKPAAAMRGAVRDKDKSKGPKQGF